MIKVNNDGTLPIVIVYLNNELPKYAVANVEYLSKTFPKIQIFIISNISKNRLKTSLKNVHYCYMPEIQFEIDRIESHSGLPKGFRNGFWISTIARFKVIEMFMQQVSIGKLLHIEADVLLLPGFPMESDIFKTNSLAYPFVSNIAAAASVFYVGSLDVLKKMNIFTLEALENNPKISDMNILADFYRLNESSVKNLFSGHHDRGESADRVIFDAATFGMYLAGLDPRNDRGISVLYSNVPGHYVNPSDYNFAFTEKFELLATKGSITYEIMNLHIHSKDIKFLRHKSFASSINQAVANDKKIVIRKFSILIWLRLLIDYVIRKLKRSRVNLRRNFNLS